jgi:protein-S-isoprenylcysteine O-methyltransferase Ste14
MKKTLSVVYSGGAYVLFLASFVYLIAFTMNLGPSHISGPASLPPLAAAAIDLVLITVFSLQHSVMARPGFKAWWTRTVPQYLERSTYVLIGSVMVVLLVVAWQPVAGDLWNITGPGMYSLLALSLMGYLLVPLCSFITDHFELFGLRQVAEYAFGWKQPKPEFKQSSLYKRVRHPMMVGWIVSFWATPHMTAGHLLFAATMTAYILIAIHFEERDLAERHGQAYRDYQARVPKLIPIPTAQSRALSTAEAEPFR